MESSSDKPKPFLGKALALVGILMIIGSILYVHHQRTETMRADSQSPHTVPFMPQPYSADQEKSWEKSVEHPAEVIELQDVHRLTSDVYIGSAKDGKEYRVVQPDPDDAYECGVIPPGELPNITRAAAQWKGATVDIPTIRQQAAKPILLERFKPIDGNDYWTLAQGKEECDVEITH